MLDLTERAAQELQAVRRDPIRFVERVFGEEVVGKQREILMALADPNVEEIHVRSCHASGKTHTVARAAAWWLQAYPGDSIVLTTAPTWKQVGDQLWGEIRDGAGRSTVALGGELQMLKWSFGPKWYATGFATSPNTAVNLQGYHASHVLVIVDEADGIAQAIWDAIDGLTTSAHVVTLAIGNPINAGSPWAKITKAAETNPRARVMKIAADDVLPHSDTRPYLLQRRYVERARAKWGEEHPLWFAKVIAEWPTLTTDTVIPLHLLERARFRAVERGPRALGVDVARFGAARTVRTLMEGHQLVWGRATAHEDTMQTAGRVFRDIEDFGPVATWVDDGGVGGGVTDKLREMQRHVTPVLNGAQAHDHDHFDNRGSELWWNLRLGFEQDLIGLAGEEPDALDDLIAQLSRAKYDMVGSRIHVRKYGFDRGRSERHMTDEERATLSPDRADSFVLAWNAAQPFVKHALARPSETQLQRMRREVLESATRAGSDDNWGN